jgi:uncharacterized membrane protein YgcG
MKKLVLDALVVESFATVDAPQELRGTVQGRQQTARYEATCGEWNTCYYTACVVINTCDPSCRQTQCITACQGGGQLTSSGCAGGGGTGGGGGTTGGGTGTDNVGCTNDCTTGMTAT